MPEQSELTLTAYRTNWAMPMKLVVAPAQREWMEQSRGRFAYRCLPLLMANQSGWFILNSHKVRIIWNGGETTDSLNVEYLEGDAPYPITSHFGHGILTWSIPFLFRTPPGYDLLARGPANMPKDGVFPLEGIVETDWSSATFTMNWKVTRPHHPIIFEVDEPICMLVPQRRGELEEFWPQEQELGQNQLESVAYKQWSESRSDFLKDLQVPDSEARRQEWQKDYFQGNAPGGKIESHQTRRNLRSF